MLRRDFVRTVVSFLFASKIARTQQPSANPAPALPGPVPWTLGLNPKTPLPETVTADQAAQPEPSFFTPLEMQTLSRLSDVLLPPIGGKPGALDAQTPLFLDMLIGSSPQPRKKLYTGGLGWLEGEAQAKYKIPFAQLDDTQAGDLLQPWLRTWMSDHPPTEPHAGFINIAHDDIRNATINSKAWSDAPTVGAERKAEVALYWSPIEPDIYSDDFTGHGLPPHVLAAPRTPHSIPAYPR